MNKSDEVKVLIEIERAMIATGKGTEMERVFKAPLLKNVNVYQVMTALRKLGVLKVTGQGTPQYSISGKYNDGTPPDVKAFIDNWNTEQ